MSIRSPLLLALACVSLSPASIAAQAPPVGHVEVVMHGERAYAVTPDGRVAHGRPGDAAWSSLPTIDLCGPERRASVAPAAAVTSDGTLWVAHGGCVSRWNGARWITERVSPGGIDALAASGPEVIVIVDALDHRGSAYGRALRSLHGSGRGWRVVDMPPVRPGDQFDPVRLAVRAPNDVVLVSTGPQRADAGLREDRSVRFDGRRWQRATTLRDGARDAVELADGRLFVLGEERSWIGWPGSAWTPFAIDTSRAIGIAGTPDDHWLRLVGVGSQPTVLQHWRGGARTEEIVLDTRRVYPTGEHVLATDHDRLLAIRAGRAEPITIAAPPARAWPGPALLAELAPAPRQPDFRTRRGETFRAELTSRLAAIELGGASFALVAAAADVPGRECNVEHQWSLVRVEGSRIAARQTLGPPSCGHLSPLADASLEAADVDGDGRVELLARVPLQIGSHRIAVLAIVDPAGLRIEGAFVTGAYATIESRTRLGEVSLYLDWSIDAAAGTLARTAAAWGLSGARARAPRLSACTRDAARDVWSCPGESLETALFAREGIAIALPVGAPR